MEIRFSGPVYGQSGYEQLTRGMVIALDKLGVRIELQPARNWNAELIELDPEDRMRLDRMANQRISPNAIQICHQRPGLETYPDAKKRICYTLFETNRCPDPWLPELNRMDKVWVFSEFNKKYWEADFIEKGIDPDKIDVIPFGIDTNLYHPGAKPAEITNKKGYTFLTLGDFTERKNFEGLVEAYVKEFTKKDDVCLVMKVHFGGFTKKHHDNIVNKIKECVDRFNPDNPPKILFFGDKLATDDMPSLYTGCDCFVLASRGEGLGMPFIEAMACGLPVISTNWSAPTDYITDNNGLLVNCDIKQIDDIEYIKKCPIALNHSWAHPHIEDIQKKMRWMYKSRDEAKKKGEIGRKDMLKHSWQNTALAIIKKIQEMG